MTADLERQLASWLAATNIGLLELRGPGVHLRLRRDGARVESVPPGVTLEAVSDAVPVTAASVGIFLHQHPQHAAPLVAPGQAVECGQPLGLLCIGALLLPVAAPQAGVFAAHIAADGAVVGYGAPLCELIGLVPDDAINP